MIIPNPFLDEAIRKFNCNTTVSTLFELDIFKKRVKISIADLVLDLFKNLRPEPFIIHNKFFPLRERGLQQAFKSCLFCFNKPL